MLGAGLLARKARQRGLKAKPWVKTSLAPGSRVVTDYLKRAGLLEDLAAVGFDLVGYGCTTCIGNSGPLKPEISAGVKAGDITACSVLSGNRNFEGRVHPEVRMNFLASPPLVVAYALAGTLDLDLDDRAARHRHRRQAGVPEGHLAERQRGAGAAARAPSTRRCSSSSYASVFNGDEHWSGIKVPAGKLYTWDAKSTYVKNPPYFEGMSHARRRRSATSTARARSRCSATPSPPTTSRPPATSPRSSPAARYLIEQGVQPADFNSYGARRGNHEVMMRGTFANIRLRNQLVPGVEGGVTVHLPSGEQTSIYDAAMRYKQERTPLVILAGREYGTGSSRDWAAKGTMLLGVRAVIAESFERIHRSNLIGMGVAPLQFQPGESAKSLGLTGRETFEITGLASGDAQGSHREGDARRGRQGRSPSRRVSGSTRPRSASTTVTAASCSTCCGSSPAPAARAERRHGGATHALARLRASGRLRPRRDDHAARHARALCARILAAQAALAASRAAARAAGGARLRGSASSDRGGLKAAFIRTALGGCRAQRARALDRDVRRPPAGATASFPQALQAIQRARARGRSSRSAQREHRPLRARHRRRRSDSRKSSVPECAGSGERLVGALTTPNRRGEEKARCVAALRARYPGIAGRRLRQRRQRSRAPEARRARRAGQRLGARAPRSGRALASCARTGGERSRATSMSGSARAPERT